MNWQEELIFALDILQKTCVLIALAYALTRTGVFGDLHKSRLTGREQVFATLLFLILGLVEVAVTNVRTTVDLDPSLFNLRITAVAAAGLLAGTSVGLIVGVGVTVMATMMVPGHNGLPAPIGISMVVSGLAAGALRDWRPRLALRPITAFLVGAGTSVFRDGLNYFLDHRKMTTFNQTWEAALIHGLSVALVLMVIKQVCDQELQAKSAALAEVRALQARMEPHFLLNSLHLLAALSATEPALVPPACAQLGRFLRASIDRHDVPFITLREELEVVDAYLAIEGLRHGSRLVVRREIEPAALSANVPPFLLQPLVENAIKHGILPKAEGGTIQIAIQQSDDALILSVSDDGVGLKFLGGEWAFGDGASQTHALSLLRRRLFALYGSQSEIAIKGGPGKSTEAVVRIPFVLESGEMLSRGEGLTRESLVGRV